jgi:hypothetical protein
MDTYGEGVPQPTFHRFQRGQLFSFDFSFRVDRDPGYPHNEFKPVQDQFQATTGGGSETEEILPSVGVALAHGLYPYIDGVPVTSNKGA